MVKIPVIDTENDVLLGYVEADTTGWKSLTPFGYAFDRAETSTAAKRIVRERSLAIVKGVWQYFDNDDKSWHFCVVKEAHDEQVTVARTNAMGFSDTHNDKIVTIVRPSEENLIPT